MKLSNGPFFYFLSGVAMSIFTGAVVLGLFWAEGDQSSSDATTRERSATGKPETSAGVNSDAATNTTVAPTTTKPFSISVEAGWIERYGRKRGNSSNMGLFWGDLYINGVSLRRTLEQKYDIKCGMVEGDYSESDGDHINIWFSSQRTTVNIIGVQATDQLLL